MDRRGFLTALLGLAGAGAMGGLALSSAQATTLDQLKNLPLDEIDMPDASAAATPDGTPIEEVWHNPWHRPPPPRYRRRGRQRRVCRTVRDRWGNRRRRCWYERW